MKIVTHNGNFHTDDVFAVAALHILFPGAEIIRSRDEKVIRSADIVVDVGEIDDATSNRFDHHQKGGAGGRLNGIPYSSLGLVWKKYGEELCGTKDVMENIDQIFVQPIDAGDNGVDTFTTVIPGVSPYLIHGIVNSYRLTWKEVDDWDKRFDECMKWAVSFLSRLIKIQKDIVEGESIVRKAYEQSEDKRLVIIGEKYDFGRELIGNALSKSPDPLYAISCRRDHRDWRLLAIKKGGGSLEPRKALPESWRAKRGEEFDRATGVNGGGFCHRTGFMCTAESREAIVKLAKLALNA